MSTTPTPIDQIPYDQMTVPQRAQYLLSKGVEAKLDIATDTLDVGYAAFANGSKLLAVGCHPSPEAAVKAGIKWLESKLGAQP